ncbi:MAG: SCO family protein [Pseudomonadota bacterium]
MRLAALAAACLIDWSAQAADPGPLPFPIQIEMAFELTDQDGRQVTEADFAGQPVMLFFGYANCQSICSVALPMMGETLRRLGPDAAELTAVMITIDPDRDTPEALAAAMPRYHPALLGLTGSEGALADIRARFQIERSVVAREPDGAPIFAHGGFVYLIGPDGQVTAALPPILSPERMAELIRARL